MCFRTSDAADLGLGAYLSVTDLVLQLNSITKRYGDFTAVEDFGIEIPKGCIYGFLGPNGAGKTTTIRMILDIVRPTSGSLTVLGAPSALQVRERIGYLPEEKGLYKKMKAWATIAYFGSLKGLKKAEAKKRAYELLEKYGLADFAESTIEALSKGMGQKVQVLASVVHRPEFVILDEPFSGLDPVNQQVMEEVIRDMAANGATILFSTHVMSHAERICDRIVLMARGRKIFDGTIPEARETMPTRVVLDADVTAEALEALPGVLAAIPLVQENQADSWEILLQEDADPQNLLQACFKSGISLRAYDHRPPTLHDVFVHLVGDDAREAKKR